MVFDDAFGHSELTKKVTIGSLNSWLQNLPAGSKSKLLILSNLNRRAYALHSTQFGPRDALV